VSSYPFVVIIFGVSSIATVFFPNAFITISYPLHVSAPTSHLQVEYTRILVNF
jgi:hypothetical protein